MPTRLVCYRLQCQRHSFRRQLVRIPWKKLPGISTIWSTYLWEFILWKNYQKTGFTASTIPNDNELLSYCRHSYNKDFYYFGNIGFISKAGNREYRKSPYVWMNSKGHTERFPSPIRYWHGPIDLSTSWWPTSWSSSRSWMIIRTFSIATSRSTPSSFSTIIMIIAVRVRTWAIFRFFTEKNC